MTWISVKDQLPAKRDGYSNSLDVNICYDNKVVSTGSYSYQLNKWYDYLYGDKDWNIMFWQPLPDPPK